MFARDKNAILSKKRRRAKTLKYLSLLIGRIFPKEGFNSLDNSLGKFFSERKALEDFSFFGIR